MDPRIYVGIDNCFAIKRWTSPAEWFRVINDLDLKYAECVSDLEIEPLLMHPGYRQDWIEQVNELQARTGINVVMFYSNNSTYDTTGLAHPDARVREHIITRWFGNFFDTASAIGAAAGYYVQAFPEEILLNKSRYDIACEHMKDSLIKVNRLAAEKGVNKVALEQMYTPHQIPFTIEGMQEVMKYTFRESGHPLYLTEDVGHHCPDYLMPNAYQLKTAHERFRTDGYVPIWLGSHEAYNMFTTEHDALSGYAIEAILLDIANNAHLFNSPSDTDCYTWIRQLGRYSPVIHLQQTDGTYSAHKGFTGENNLNGIIHPEKILTALKESYAAPTDFTMPEPAEDIYLILELYMSTKDIGYQGLYTIAQSVEYLRQFIPHDGMRLSELINNTGNF